MFDYFVLRGLWHLQLWRAGSGVSILSPSRLTCDRDEAFPVAGWKVREETYEALIARLRHDLVCMRGRPMS